MMKIVLSRFPYRNIIFLITFLSTLSFSQDIVEENIETDNVDSSISQQPLQSKKPSTNYLQKDIINARVLGVSGCMIHFSGTIILISSIIIEEPTLFWIGIGMDFLGPIPSCAGASIMEDAMEEEYTSFPRHRYWGYYATGGVFYGLYAVTHVAEFVAYSHGGFQYEATEIAFQVGRILTYCAAQVYSAIATIGPLYYIRKAEHRIQKGSAFNIRVLPDFTMNGGKGVYIVGTF